MIRRNNPVLCLAHEARRSCHRLDRAGESCARCRGRPRWRCPWTCIRRRIACRTGSSGARRAGTRACGSRPSVACARPCRGRHDVRRRRLLARLLLPARGVLCAARGGAGSGVLVLLSSRRGLLPLCTELPRPLAAGGAGAVPIYLLIMATKPETTNDIKVDSNAHYLEEVFTDRRVGTIRRMTPVKKDGERDQARAVLYIGETQVLTPAGALPIGFEIGAGSLEEAAEKFGQLAREAIERTVKELQEMRRQAASQIVVPQGPLPPVPPGGKIQMP